MTPKGDHIPKEHGGRLPSQPVQRRGTQGEGVTPAREKAGQPCGIAQAEAYSVSLRKLNRTKTKSKPNQRRESNINCRGLRKNTDRT